MEGRAWLRNAVPFDELRELERLSSGFGNPGRRFSGDVSLCDAITSARFSKTLRDLWPSVKPVRLVSFDKSPGANWCVPWHQDRVIAVNQRADMEGFSNWSRKSGIWHCQPPVRFLEKMLFVRVHLDRNTDCNGAMEIALGSHRAGFVATDKAADIAHQYETELTAAEPGDVLVLAMLTLHRSLPSLTQERRRTLRIDYSPDTLPEPLDWAI